MPERSTLSECACLSSSVGRLLTWSCVLTLVRRSSSVWLARLNSVGSTTYILTGIQAHTYNTGKHIKSHPAAVNNQERLGGGEQVYLIPAECALVWCLK
ncbi:hypothetical protein LX36DRAFT_652716 [Colletotrichum falcatum]|nr:hypothetical protein LX36DRAFT_652716 [Colletotrichum falcatum]